MEKQYKVSWDGGGVDWCFYTDDYNEAVAKCNEHGTEADNHCLVYDQLNRKVVYNAFER